MRANKYLERDFEEEIPKASIKNFEQRYIIVIVLTIIFTVLGLMLPSISTLFLQEVHLVQMQEQEFIDTMYSSGKLQEEEKSEITYNLPIVAQEVFVELGDTVSIGDKIATIDFDKTKQAILNLISMTSLIDDSILSAFYSFDMDIDEDLINSMIPTQILADFDGVVSTLNVSKGNVVSPTESIAVISNLSELEAVLTVSESYADKVQLNQTVILEVEALDDEKYIGTISQISPIAHETLVGTSLETVVNVYVDLDDEDSNLKSGYTVSATIELADTQTLTTLPYEAVNQDIDNNEYVYVYDNGKAIKKIITTGEELADSIQVTSGITADDIIILENQSITNDNQYVNVIKEGS